VIFQKSPRKIPLLIFGPYVRSAMRITPPVHLPGATEFSADRELLSPIWVVEMLKQTAWVFSDLEKATALDKDWGRRKEPGSWALVYMAFVVSGFTDIEPWWANTGDELWRACGFDTRPAYQTTYERFVELEEVREEFSLAAAKLIQHARRHEPRIGNHIHVDGTEAETHAALVHDCKPGEGCLFGGAKPKRTAARPKRESTERVRAERQKDAGLAPDETLDPELELGDADEVMELPDGRMRVRVGQHWYRTLDSTAGIRAYTGPRGAKRFWHGFYNEKATDHFTGAPIAVGVYSASRQEYAIYPDLFERASAALGENPQSVVCDKGYSVESVFAFNTSLGVASVMPWRKRRGQDTRQDVGSHDRHGIPRCRHCGAPGKFVRFNKSPKPRLWFHCVAGTTPACNKDQSILCSKDWRLLLPLWRTDPIYHELEASHSIYERVHRHWRERYQVAGDGLSNRPKRRGLAWQDLRAQAALVAEWLRISWREGWLGSARRNAANPTRFGEGKRRAESFRLYRAKAGLTLPYGVAAAALGLGLEEPPSRRGKAPPGESDTAPF
jgi:hypothetical protein